MNGMCIALRNGARTKTVFIEQDVLELENLNRQTAARRRQAEKQEAEQIRRAAEKKKSLCREQARKRAYTLRVMRQELLLLAGMAGLGAANHYGLMSPVLALPLMVTAFGGMCLIAGKYWGVRKRW